MNADTGKHDFLKSQSRENDLKRLLRSLGLRNRQQLRRIERREQMRNEHRRTRRTMRRQGDRLERDLKE